MRTGDPPTIPPEDADDIEIRAVFGAMSEGVVVQGADGAIRSCNAAAERILGLSAEQLAGRTSLDPRWRAVREDGSPFEGPEHPAMITLRTGEPQRGVLMGLHRVDGTHGWISINTAPLFRPGGAIPYAVVATFADVTEQRAATAALQRHDAHLHLALAAARMGTWEWRVGAAVEWSDEVYEIFGAERAAFDGTLEGYLALVHEGDRAQLADTIRRALEDPELGNRFEAEHRILTPAGQLRWARCQGRVFHDASGQPTRMVGTVSDVTQRVRMESELARAQRMESIGRLAGGIAHDFNNLLTAILGSTELAMERIEPRNAARELLEIVQSASQQAARLTRQLLAFAREQPLELTLVPVDGLVDDVRRLIASLVGEDVALDVRLGAAGSVRADRGQLEQVLMNLAVNAREAMPRGGQLSIETSTIVLDGSGSAELGLAPGAYVRVVVSDTGTGMAPEVAERALEPFFTTKEQGSGLGLATCYGIAGQLGGRLLLESSLGVGTRVTLLLPEAGPAPAMHHDGQGGAPADVTLPRGRETVLLVEDEPRVREVTARALSGLGYEVLMATDAADAMRVAGTHPREIHLLVSDVVMPGESGIELAKRFVTSRPGAVVLLVSGYAPDARGELEHARFAQLGKPYDLAALARRVRTLLDEAATRTAQPASAALEG